MERIKKLLRLQIGGGGISESTYHNLLDSEKKMLEKKGKKYFLKEKYRKKIKVGVTGGVFDVLHIGHIEMLKEIKKRCDFLVVVVASDTIASKKRKPIHPSQYRLKMVESLKMVDLALKGGPNPYRTLKKIDPDVIFYGYDQPDIFKDVKIKKIRIKKKVNDNIFKSRKIIARIGI